MIATESWDRHPAVLVWWVLNGIDAARCRVEVIATTNMANRSPWRKGHHGTSRLLCWLMASAARG